jgi:hypothetical protein
MEIRFHVDPDTGLPHIYGHGITEDEVEQVLRGLGDDVPARRDSRMKIGQTAAGRYLQVIYVPDDDGVGVFVIDHGLSSERQEQEGIPASAKEEKTMNKKKKQKLPRGWSEKRIREVIDHYENQTDEEQHTEIEAALKAENITMMAVPTELVPEVSAFIAKRHSA